jgi:hypothetical protein
MADGADIFITRVADGNVQRQMVMINKRVQVVKELKQSKSLDKRLTTQWLLDPSPFQPIGDSVTGPSAKNKRGKPQLKVTQPRQ